MGRKKKGVKGAGGATASLPRNNWSHICQEWICRVVESLGYVTDEWGKVWRRLWGKEPTIGGGAPTGDPGHGPGVDSTAFGGQADGRYEVIIFHGGWESHESNVVVKGVLVVQRMVHDDISSSLCFVDSHPILAMATQDHCDVAVVTFLRHKNIKTKVGQLNKKVPKWLELFFIALKQTLFGCCACWGFLTVIVEIHLFNINCCFSEMCNLPFNFSLPPLPTEPLLFVQAALVRIGLLG